MPATTDTAELTSRERMMLTALREAYLSLECRDGTAHVTALVCDAIDSATQTASDGAAELVELGARDPGLAQALAPVSTDLRLIAAAPAMLAVLKRIKIVMDGIVHPAMRRSDDALSEVEAAITLATSAEG